MIGDLPANDTISGFLVYVDVEDIDESIKLINENGGKIIREKHEIPQMGWYARGKDSEGNLFSLWQNHVAQAQLFEKPE